MIQDTAGNFIREPVQNCDCNSTGGCKKCAIRKYEPTLLPSDNEWEKEFDENTDKQFPEGKYTFAFSTEKGERVMTVNEFFPLSEAIEFAQKYAREFKTKPNWVLDNNGVRRILEDYKTFIRQKLAETEKAYGGCKKCYGKGYATVRYGEEGYDDFGGEGYVSPIRTNLHFCSCDRGKQLKKYFENVNPKLNKFEPLNCPLDHQCVNPQTGESVPHSSNWEERVSSQVNLIVENYAGVMTGERIDFQKALLVGLKSIISTELAEAEDRGRQEGQQIADAVYNEAMRIGNKQFIESNKIAEKRAVSDFVERVRMVAKKYMTFPHNIASAKHGESWNVQKEWREMLAKFLAHILSLLTKEIG